MRWDNVVGITKRIRPGRSCFGNTAKTRRFSLSPDGQEELWHQPSPSVEITHEKGHPHLYSHGMPSRRGQGQLTFISGTKSAIDTSTVTTAN
jgi:hypothetical protein